MEPLTGDDEDVSDVTAIFAYGTLRGDYNESGDRWGVIGKSNGKWEKASIRGFRLYQDRKKPFPFAVQTGNDEDVLHGTLITWPGGDADARAGIAAAERMVLCGYEDCDYKRSVVPARRDPDDRAAELAGADLEDDLLVAKAFMYYWSFQNDVLRKCHCFSSGDWLRPTTVMESSSGHVQAMFAYGRLRADYDADHPDLGGTWIEALAVGFKLYKASEEQFPFAVYTGNENDVLHGTLRTWSGVDEARRALAAVDELEGVNDAEPLKGNYRRTVTEVSWAVAGGGHGSTMAFLYYQEWPLEHLSRCKLYGDGDWLRSHVAL